MGPSESNAEEDEHEEVEVDFSSPKGQMVQYINQQMKKPQLDDSLSKVLDKFIQLLDQQTVFLNHGLVQMNFAEDALLLQSCTRYYGKRVDLLWDNLLQVHLLMVKSGGKAAAKCIDPIKREERQKTLQKLEERLNRGKRKKIKLFDPPVNPDPLPEDNREITERLQSDALFQLDYILQKKWQNIAELDNLELGHLYHSSFVKHVYEMKENLNKNQTTDHNFKELTNPNRIKHWSPLTSQWVRGIFKENDECLRPDDNFVIAKLRLDFYLRSKWVHKNHINPTHSYETFRTRYEQYKYEFFFNESRKIQNMPQTTTHDIKQFYKALAKKEELALKLVGDLQAKNMSNLPIVSFQTVIVDPLVEDYQGIFNSYIPEGFEPANPPHIEDFIKDNEVNMFADIEPEMCNLFQNEHGSPNHSTQTRADSGFSDGGFNDEDDYRYDATTGAVTPFECDVEARKDGDQSIVQDSQIDNSEIEASIIMQTGDATKTKKTNEFKATESMNSDLESFSQCASVADLLKGSYFKETPYLTTVVYNANKKKERVAKVQNLSRKRQLRVETGGKTRVSKRRRLTLNQLEKLMCSIVTPVPVPKWNNFYSLHYQAGFGEGEVEHVDYVPECDEVISDNTTALNDAEEEVEKDTMSSLQDSGYISSSPIILNGNIGIAESSERLSPPLVDPICTNRSTPEYEAMQSRVNEWKDFIYEKLDNLGDSDFDIHAYGSNIMSQLRPDKPTYFKDIMQGKSSSEVVRCFVSSLQLANTCNIEISGSKMGELSNDSLTLKLLSLERYHEKFQAYQAPSKEAFHHKMKFVMESNKCKKLKLKHDINQASCQPLLSIPTTNIDSTSQAPDMNRSEPGNASLCRTPNSKRGNVKVFSSTPRCSATWKDIDEASNSYRAEERQKSYKCRPHTPNRSSIDSGCISYFDDDFLADFEELQDIRNCT